MEAGQHFGVVVAVQAYAADQELTGIKYARK
jgi:hypothetical protein